MAKTRKARLSDIEGITLLWNALVEDQAGRMKMAGDENSAMDPLKTDAQEIFAAFLGRNIRSGKGMVQVAEEGGDLVGYLLGFLQPRIPVFEGGVTAYVSDLYVAPDHRRKGTASALMDRFEAWARSKKASDITLQVIPTNIGAMDLYSKRGMGNVYMMKRKRLRGKIDIV